MEDQFYKFDPGTNTSRCPIPTRFEHVLKFITKVENFLGLHSQADITNINKQLDQTLNLMISNIIQRVIAQVIGQTPAGFVTIKGTEDGALHVYLAETAATLEMLATLQAGTNLIGKVEGPESIKDATYAAIDFASTDDQEIIPGETGKKIKICSFYFTVGGETTIELCDGAAGCTGAMNFGGTNEPRGISVSHPIVPGVLSVNNGFVMKASAAVQVSGAVVYYKE